MENIQAYKALLQVAEKNGVSLNEVVTEIETAIRNSIEQAIKDNNVEALAMWAQIPCQGEYPSAVELITHIGGQIR